MAYGAAPQGINVLNELLKNYQSYFQRIKDITYLSEKFNQNLYGKNNCKFLYNEKVFDGKVDKVLNNGNLVACLETNEPKEFKSSEIKIIF